MKSFLLVALASIKRVGDLQAFSVDESCLEFGPSDDHLQGPGSEPASAAPRGGRPSPGFALSSLRLPTVN